MEHAKLTVLLVTLVFSCRADAVIFNTEIQPEPDYMGRAVIILPEEKNATVSVQCVSFQDGNLRVTFWFIQRFGERQPEPIFLSSTQFVRSGGVNQILTIVNITQDLDRAEIWCGPVDVQIEPRFLLGFEGD